MWNHRFGVEVGNGTGLPLYWDGSRLCPSLRPVLAVKWLLFNGKGAQLLWGHVKIGFETQLWQRWIEGKNRNAAFCTPSILKWFWLSTRIFNEGKEIVYHCECIKPLWSAFHKTDYWHASFPFALHKRKSWKCFETLLTTVRRPLLNMTW